MARPPSSLTRTRFAKRVGKLAGSFSGTMSQASRFAKQRAWAWPIIGFTMLLVIGIGVNAAIESTMKENLASELQTLLTVEADMLRTWLSAQENNAESMANSQDIRNLANEILQPETEAKAKKHHEKSLP